MDVLEELRVSAEGNIQREGSLVGGLEEFESMRSSFVEGVRLLMEEFESNSDSWDESSIPGMEQVLVSLLDDGVCVATPFQLSEKIKSAIRQSAVEWDFE